MEFDRDGPVSLYVQLKRFILDQIENGDLQPSSRLPSERQLSEEFGVSRTTVRRALDDLAREGHIFTRVGRGTFVAERKIDQNLQVLTGFTQDMQERDLKASARILDSGLLQASAELAGALHIQEGAQVVRLKRLRIADGVPLAVESAHLPHHLCPGVLEHDLETGSLYEVLGNRYGLKLARAKQKIEAVLANEEEAQLLGLVRPSPVLLMERRTYLSSGDVIEYVKSAYRGDRYTFHVQLLGNG